MGQDLKDTLLLPRTDFPMRAELARREPARVAHWEKSGLYGAIQRAREGGPCFVLHDGPPFTNGDVHIGTALNKVLKDVVNRYKSMRGFRTPYVPGWDCHGLPIEQKVVRELHEEKARAGTAELRARCDAFAETWIARQAAQFRRLGVLADWENAYKTKAPAYEADILRTFAAFVERGLVYRRKKPVYYSIPFETALAEAEVEYKEHVSPSIWVKFNIPEAEARSRGLPSDKPLGIVIWTTTPWTLPANQAVAVNAELDYVVLEPLEGPFLGERLIVAERCYLDFLPKLGLRFPSETSSPGESAKIVHTVKGSALRGLKTGHPFLARTSPVVLADYVTTDSGTGCVHIAPGHGSEDYETGLEYGLAIYCPIDGHGKYAPDPDYPELEIPNDLIGVTTLETPEDLAAKRTSPANIAVLGKLKAAKALVRSEKHSHAYPHCWRSKTPVIYCAQYQWFVNLDEAPRPPPAKEPNESAIGGAARGSASPLSPRRAALAAIGKVAWIPAWGESRIRGAVESRPHWCISRNRKWGVPIPAFYDSKTGAPFLDAGIIRAMADKIETLGTNFWYEAPVEKLLEGVALPGGWPGVDRLARGLDTLDVWIDSGSSHAAVLRRGRGGTRWPADLYLEGSDQHRGWFQSSLWTSVVAFGEAPYKAVLTHGFIVDEDRKKISKSGAYEKPQTSDAYVGEYGADVIRLWIVSQDFRDDLPVSREILSHVGETYRLIRNTFRFQLANLFDFDPARHAVPAAELDFLDRWALGQAAALVRACAAAYDACEFHRVYQLCNQFCSVALSATYHDILKDRLYTRRADDRLRRSSQTAVHAVHRTLVKLLAPILVFTADEAWSFGRSGSEFGGDSVHLEQWPEPPAEWNDEAAARDMDLLLKVRGRVNELLEKERQRGAIGKSTEADVTVEVSPGGPMGGLFERTDPGRLAEILMVANVSVHRLAPGAAEGALAASNPPDAEAPAFRIRHARELGHVRCPRCWRWVPELEPAPGRLERVCSRCVAALNP